MAKEMKNFATAPHEGNDVDLAVQAHVENVVVKPNQAPNLQSDTGVDDEQEKVTVNPIDGAPTCSLSPYTLIKPMHVLPLIKSISTLPTVDITSTKLFILQ